MRFLKYVSDLHLELRKSINHPKLSPLWTSNSSHKVYLALLGDISNPHSSNLFEFLQKVSPKYEKIFYVPGNHEYYNLTPQNLQTKNQMKSKLQDICNSFSNVILLDNSTYILDNIKIIGSTLWSRVDKHHKSIINQFLNDYHLIYNESLFPIRISDTNKWNSEALKFIETEIQFSELPCIVLSHHAPLFSHPDQNQYTALPKYLNGKFNQAFHNDLRHLMNKPVAAWLYGHTHYSGNFVYNGVYVGTNQLGYHHEETEINFEPNQAINLDEINIYS